MFWPRLLIFLGDSKKSLESEESGWVRRVWERIRRARVSESYMSVCVLPLRDLKGIRYGVLLCTSDIDLICLLYFDSFVSGEKVMIISLAFGSDLERGKHID